MVSRIVSLLKKHRQGLSFGKIAAKLYLSSRERIELKKHLHTLHAGGVVILSQKKYFLRPRAGIIQGELITSQPGFAFVRPDENSGEDVYIPMKSTGGALLGDRVEVFVKEGRRGKPEGRITRILQRKKKVILGLYRERAGQPFVRPLEAHLAEDIPFKNTTGSRLKEGMVISIDRKSLSLDRVLGDLENPGVDTRIVIFSHSLKVAFGLDAEKQAQGIPSRIPSSALLGRTDFRNWMSITIDGENAQDFDDAVSIRKLPGGNVLLGVHIADVSHYVEPGSALEEEALARGTSVYFPGLTLPMFPERLANEICSLRPREDKLTMTVLLEIDQEGNTVSSDFHPSVIRTAERMTYTSVLKILEGNVKESKKHKALVPDLLLMKELALRLREKRNLEGSLDFDLAEPELIYEGEVLHAVVAAERNEAHCLIEEFMVAANEAVAIFLTSENRAFLYRVHPPPSVEALSKLEKILASFDLSLPSPKKVRAKDLQKVLEKAAGSAEEKFLNFQLLRSQKIAFYSADNEGHFGLAKDVYTHFTSPIRRYPDLIVHRVLKNTLEGEAKDLTSLDFLARHCSELQRNAEAAERTLVEWRIFRFLKGKLGDLFDGIVTDVVRAGVAVELNDYFVTGWIPSFDLGQAFLFRKTEKKMIDRRTGKVIGLGYPVCVRLDAVDPLRRRMTLALCDT